MIKLSLLKSLAQLTETLPAIYKSNGKLHEIIANNNNHHNFVFKKSKLNKEEINKNPEEAPILDEDKTGIILDSKKKSIIMCLL